MRDKTVCHYVVIKHSRNRNVNTPECANLQYGKNNKGAQPLNFLYVCNTIRAFHSYSPFFFLRYLFKCSGWVRLHSFWYSLWNFPWYSRWYSLWYSLNRSRWLILHSVDCSGWALFHSLLFCFFRSLYSGSFLYRSLHLFCLISLRPSSYCFMHSLQMLITAKAPRSNL